MPRQPRRPLARKATPEQEKLVEDFTASVRALMEASRMAVTTYDAHREVLGTFEVMERLREATALVEAILK